MNGDRLRIPQDHDYFHAIGLAAVAFARLEWDAVWCCERLDGGYINTIEPRRKTAGRIGQEMSALFSRVADEALRLRIEPLAVEFCSIVEERNGLLHGKPGSTQNGDQRLFRHEWEWTIDAVNAFSDRCVGAGLPLNSFLYAELGEGCSIALNPL